MHFARALGCIKMGYTAPHLFAIYDTRGLSDFESFSLTYRLCVGLSGTLTIGAGCASDM